MSLAVVDCLLSDPEALIEEIRLIVYKQGFGLVEKALFDEGMRYIAGTAGLRVMACLKRGGNETGEHVWDEEMRLRLTPHMICPAWNYMLSP